MKCHGKFRGKLTPSFQFRLGKVLPISLKRARRVKISNFMGLFCPKGSLVQLKTVAGVSSCDTERPSKVWGKTCTWFSIQPQKNWVNFLRACQKVKISNFNGWFCLKDELLEQKIDRTVSCADSEGLWKVSAKSESWFPIQPSQKW